uniref:Uncharacterized protein n=1 Tax=Parascaris univalens TaxID=6257 RepID=A0A915AMC0_PARUN
FCVPRRNPMGLCTSNVYHEDEKGVDDGLLQYLNYSQQPDDEYRQLDTENDQKGDTAVEHIFKKTKTVYGQPPKDMRGTVIDWKADYEIHLNKRPCPYDFPAFQFDKPPDYDEKWNSSTHRIITLLRISTKLQKKEAEKLEAEKVTEKTSSRQQKPETGEEADKKEGGKKKSRTKSMPRDDKKQKRSANADLDECSLDD